jgi:hypothetical protein
MTTSPSWVLLHSHEAYFRDTANEQWIDAIGGRPLFAIFVQQTLVTSQPFLLDVAQGSLQSLPYEGKWVSGFAFSTDGATLATGGVCDIELLDLHTGAVFHTERCRNDRNQNLNPKRFSPDGAILVAEGDRGQLCVFDAHDGHLMGSGNSAARGGYDRIDVSFNAYRVAVQRSNDHFRDSEHRPGRACPRHHSRPCVREWPRNASACIDAKRLAVRHVRSMGRGCLGYHHGEETIGDQ